MKTFSVKVDKRSRKQMITFLNKHFRYDTMNSWNRSTSYANNLKVHRLGLDNDIVNNLYQLINIDSFYYPIKDLQSEFGEEYNYTYQARFNGRSGGYLVLYRGGRKKSEYKSKCYECGQLNYKLCPETDKEKLIALVQSKIWIPEIVYDNLKASFDEHGFSKEDAMFFIKTVKRGDEYSLDCTCGKCGQPTRENLNYPIYDIFISPGMNIDMHEDFEEWDIAELRDRVELVQRFDKLCDDIVEYSINTAKEFEVVDKQIEVPKTIKIMKRRQP